LRIIETNENGGLSSEDLAHVHEHLRRGGVCILPTETGYLLGVDGRNQEAITHVFTIKGRAPEHPIHLAVHSVDAASRYAALCPRSRASLEALGPGPLSVIGPAREGVPLALQAGTGTVGVRIPLHTATQQILRETDIPLTATSANLSGQPAEIALDRIQAQLGDELTSGWVAVRDDNRLHERPSTLIRWEGDVLHVLRSGPISEAELRRVTETMPGSPA